MNVICNNKKCRNNKNNTCMVQTIEITFDGICSAWQIYEEIEEYEKYQKKKKDRIIKKYLDV